MAVVDLRKGDCLEVMKSIPDGSIDLILTDPPYQITACKWDLLIPFEPMWKEVWRICSPNAAVVFFGNQPFTSKMVSSQAKYFKYQWIWDKVRGSNFASVKKRPFKSHEDIMVFYKKQPTYNPQMWMGKPYKAKQSYVGDSYHLKSKEDHEEGVVTVSNGERYPLSILRYSKQSGKHPNQKPVALLEYLIKTYTLEGETVLDFTMGSGSTGVAAKNLNRNFIGIELDDKYFEIAKERIGE